MRIVIKSKGDYSKAEGYFRKIRDAIRHRKLDKYGEMGAAALASATPVDSGLTADSWSYEIEQTADSATITWVNNNIQGGNFNVAVALQYGHGTGTGGYVQGRDYINPAIQPIFDQIADEAWKEIISV